MTSNLLTRTEAAKRATLISNATYTLGLDLTDNDTTFAVEATVGFECAAPGESTFIDFTAPTLHRAVLNGTPLPDGAFDGNRIHLPGLRAHNTLVVSGRGAYSRTGTGLHRFTDPIDQCTYLHTQFEPFDAHRVFPCFDQPDLKARFALTVLAQPDWIVASNGVATHHVVGRNVQWSFQPLPPISTYLVAVVAGPFHTVTDDRSDVPMRVMCRQSLAQHLDADDIIEITRQGLDYFGTLFDYRYPFGKYDQVFVPEFRSGAMENPGCITFNEMFIFRSAATDALREARASAILHELAHMWFGDLVTMRWWDDLWLNESFATYMATRAMVEATRFTTGWVTFASGTKATAYRQDQLPTTHPISADIADTDALRVHFDAITYSKGASVLRQLTAWVGLDAFDEGLRDYFRRHAFDNATLHDFLTALEKTSGRSLGDWSGEWLQTAGVNTMRPVLEVADDRIASLVIRQEAIEEHPTLRSHRVTVSGHRCTPDGLMEVSRTDIDVVGERTPVPDFDGVGRPDLLLINDGDVSYAKIRFDSGSLATLMRHLRDIADPLNRGLCWNALWDMVRDGELPTHQFIDVVATHITAEPTLTTVQRLLTFVTTAVDEYATPVTRARARTGLAILAHSQLNSAAPSSDSQRIWAEAWIGLTDDFTHLASLLDGASVISGLAVDVDLRWRLIGALSTRGAFPVDLIEGELARDPSDIGHRRAAALRAARPTAEAKRQAWQDIFHDTSLPLATKQAMALGFAQPAQEELLEPYVARYLDALPGIWAESSADEALALTRSLYPSAVITDAAIALTDDSLERTDHTAITRRILLEGADGVRRALRARALDQASPTLVTFPQPGAIGTTLHVLGR